MSFPSIFDPSMRTLLSVQGFPTSSIPSTIVLDRQHRVAHIFLGAVTAQQLDPVVAAVAAEGGTPAGRRGVELGLAVTPPSTLPDTPFHPAATVDVRDRCSGRGSLRTVAAADGWPCSRSATEMNSIAETIVSGPFVVAALLSVAAGAVSFASPVRGAAGARLPVLPGRAGRR